MSTRGMTPSQRFWSQVEKSDECWIWTGGLDKDGYGRLSFGGKNHRAHRFSYELQVAPIPDGLVIDHLCRNRACVNPEHLEPVTNYENRMRGEGPHAQNRRKTHCKNGHEFTPENTYQSTNGRACRECKRNLKRAWRAARREAGLPHV